MWRGKAVRVPLTSNDGGGRKRVGATSEDDDAGCSSGGGQWDQSQRGSDRHMACSRTGRALR
jgi:hypothetical protein